MSHRSKSGQTQKRHAAIQRKKRRQKRKKAVLIASGTIRKGSAPAPAATA